MAKKAVRASKTAARARKHVYFFGSGKAEGNRNMKDLLGGKGSGLAEMTNAGLPVPPGFTISTDVCSIYYKEHRKIPADIETEIALHVKKLEKAAGATLGSDTNPLLVSVRSGAKFSMPGMMDTILNLGLNDAAVEGLKARTANGRFAFDSYRRFMQMFGNVVLEIPKDAFEHEFEAVKAARGAKLDTDLDEAALREVVERYKQVARTRSGRAFPQDPREQLRMARNAVFRSWMNPRAIEYRRIYDIPDHIGTAVNVQMMVFGNMGDRCATGVGFTRNPGTGAKEFYGEFLINAQGEDVVSGVRTPQPIRDLEKVMPKAYKELRQITTRLERHYKDIQDFEFTVQDERLFMLQTRNGKRTGYAAVVIATDFVKEKLISPKEAILQVDPESLMQLLAPGFDQKEWKAIPLATRGLPASPGAASGHVVFSADEAVKWSDAGKPVILVRRETVPDDIHGMFVSQGILTATGGMTSHAAVVGRQMGKPSIVGAGELGISEAGKVFSVGGHTVREGDFISFDGLTGEVKLAKVASKPSEILQVVNGEMKPAASDLYRRFSQLLAWSDRFRRLGIRANADQPDQAELAYAFGARGIGLCRTEHMFFGEGRIPIVQRMILADNEADRRSALAELLPMQRDDFYGVFKAMHGEPVTIRTIDPPLHEFLPKREELMVEIAVLEAKGQTGKVLKEKQKLLHRVEQLHEFNPMLGHRGVRLGVTYPEITEMQTRAIIEAACMLAKEGLKVVPEIMIPLVGLVKELRDQKAIVDRVAAEVMRERQVKIKYLVGTMIEVPRGAMTADQIAGEAQFFSFGTNDLTQLTFGFSRDDIGKFLRVYQEKKILDRDPFATFDVEGVGPVVRTAVELGRKARPGLKLGICGEHGGDPSSIHFFDKVGLDYVSCSPYRAPVARLAAAQAALSVKVGDLITVYVYEHGTTRLVDRVEPAWLDPGSHATLWVDLSAATPEEGRALLAETFHFHPLSVEDALSDVHHPKIEAYDSYLYVILHGVDFHPGDHEFATRDIDFFLGLNYLVTVHDGRSRSIHTLRTVCEQHAHILEEGPVALMHRIVDSMVDNYAPEMAELEDEMDRLEDEAIVGASDKMVRPILAVKRDLASLRRVVIPQRDVVGRLARREFPQISNEMAYRFRDVYDHLVRYSDEAAMFQDRVTSILEGYLSAISNRLNQVMKVLTVMSTIFLPLTVLTGMWGMNVLLPVFPGGEHAQFWWVAGIMLSISAVMLAAFRRQGWV